MLQPRSICVYTGNIIASVFLVVQGLKKRRSSFKPYERAERTADRHSSKGWCSAYRDES